MVGAELSGAVWEDVDGGTEDEKYEAKDGSVV